MIQSIYWWKKSIPDHLHFLSSQYPVSFRNTSDYRLFFAQIIKQLSPFVDVVETPFTNSSFRSDRCLIKSNGPNHNPVLTGMFLCSVSYQSFQLALQPSTRTFCFHMHWFLLSVQKNKGWGSVKCWPSVRARARARVCVCVDSPLFSVYSLSLSCECVSVCLPLACPLL